MKSRKLTLVTIVFFVTFATPLFLTGQTARYAVTDLGTLGGTFSLALGINDKGWVVGVSSLPDDAAFHAFLWKKNLLIDLGTLGGPNSVAGYPLNERGQIGGVAETSTPDPLGEDFCAYFNVHHLICLPFVWQNGVMRVLPTLGGSSGEANQINNRGQIVGLAENSTLDPTCPPPGPPFFELLEFKPVLWEKDEIHELPTFAGDTVGTAHSINDKGQAAGASGNCINNFVHALLWEDGFATDLGNLGGTTNTNAFDINNQGQVVGVSTLPDETTFHAFLWEKGVMRDLGALPGDVVSAADGINSKGQVVGGSFDIEGNGRAFIWRNGLMTDLNTLIPADSALFLIEATGCINSRGQIAGFALQTSTGEVHAFLLTPNTEGATSSAPAVADAQSRRGPKVVLPANVREMLGKLARPYLRGRLQGLNLK